MSEDAIQIKGVPGYDGEYPLDPSTLTKGEMRIIKQICHLSGLALAEAFAEDDVEVAAALATVALKRSGHRYWQGFNEASDAIMVADLEIRFVTKNGDEAESADPPSAPDGGG